MLAKSTLKNGTLGTLIAAGLAIGLVVGASSPIGAVPYRAKARPASGPSRTAPPRETITLSTGRGQLINLPGPISDLFVASDKIADVQVRSSRQIYVFGKDAGETTVYATNKAGGVVYSANVRVGQNIGSVQQMLNMAMPDSGIKATVMNGLVLLTGTVSAPDDVEQAQRLTQALVGKQFEIVNQIRSTTPMQVNLQVRIAEVNRDFVKSIGVNLLTRDRSGGFLFGVSRGNAGTIGTITDSNSSTGLPKGATSYAFNAATSATTIGMAGHLLGLDILSTLDLAENDGMANVLAEPNLTALSGETASFLAGGEIPIPVPQYQGVTTIEYKQYGVSLAFTPTVLSNGRISMRVRPEVSQLTTSSVTIQGYTIPGLTTRRAETTVELGSGQSFMIGGLLSQTTNNTIDKAPGLGDLPILGALFRSRSYQRQETELVIIVTPYLVKPVSASQMASPTDGYRQPTDVQGVLGAQSFDGKTGDRRPVPTMAPPPAGVLPPAPGFAPPGANADPADRRKKTAREQASANPGFSIN
ncbi:type II and III secretion system protein family protein [Flavisphingomonas formosensis]|uniref:type II and III secretion system protein family protein n=1 Tax=Flavisphingomonas formosensis TaxID=861534 RepID=UPI0012F8AC0A|nr:type II and III secretion system protein family protein [Sphingomonas formosensis]